MKRRLKKYLKKILKRMQPRVLWVARDSNGSAYYNFFDSRKKALSHMTTNLLGDTIWEYPMFEACPEKAHEAGLELEPGAGPVPYVMRKARSRGFIHNIIERVTK